MVIVRTHNEQPEGRPLAGRVAYLVGVGGCGMSGLARLLMRLRVRVSGSDRTPSGVTEALERDGIGVTFDQTAGQLPEEADLVIASAAIPADHPELLAATSRGVEVWSYAEALGRCMAGRTGVAVAGTHGKSTTIAMLGHTLISAGLDPTVIVGAMVPQLAEGGAEPTGFRLGGASITKGCLQGRAGLLLAEACEYNRSFHHLRPTIGAIGCVEADHLDIYGSLDAVVEAFAGFARLLPPKDEGGRLLIAHTGAHRREVTAGVSAQVETIGYEPSADWQVTYDTRTRRVGLIRSGRPVCDWELAIPGEHMAFNSAIAGVLAIWCGAKPDEVSDGLGTFAGLDRRLQHLGDIRLSKDEGRRGVVRVYDDYGHHPTEIETTLRALREHDRPDEHGGRLVCVFQPHQHSRTRFFMEEFASAFGHADVVVVPEIYFVRDSEQEKSRVSAADLVERLRERSVRAMHLHPFGAIVEQLENLVRAGDLLVVMGAGPVWQVAHQYMAMHGSAPSSMATDAGVRGSTSADVARGVGSGVPEGSGEER